AGPAPSAGLSAGGPGRLPAAAGLSARFVQPGRPDRVLRADGAAIRDAGPALRARGAVAEPARPAGRDGAGRHPDRRDRGRRGAGRAIDPDRDRVHRDHAGAAQGRRAAIA
ncbi:14083_t:CDS:1, partial [Entrophospora sp. SA101]